MADEEYDVTTANKPTGYSASKVLNHMDGNVAYFPYTAVKHITDDLELISMPWNQRADFEFYLLNYNVDRNADLATGANSLSTLFRTRNLGKALSFKRGYREGIASICAIILLITFFGMFITGIIMMIVFKLMKKEYPYGVAKTFLLNSVGVIIIIFAIIFLSNTVFKLIATTENMVK
jgi:hypothetical protein